MCTPLVLGSARGRTAQIKRTPARRALRVSFQPNMVRKVGPGEGWARASLLIGETSQTAAAAGAARGW